MHRALRSALAAVWLTLAAISPAAAQRFSYITTLGADTLSFEQFDRTATQIVGDWITLYGGIMVHHYEIALRSDGSVSRYQLALHRLSGKDEGSIDIRFDGDSATVHPSEGKEQRFAARETFPLFANTIAPIDVIVSHARTAKRDSSLVSAVPAFGPYRSREAPVVFFAHDSLWLGNPRAPLRGRLDSDGHLAGVSAAASTTRTETRRVKAYDLRAQVAHFPNIPDSLNILGVLSISPRDTVRATLGDASIMIDYGRPSVRGRAVFSHGVLGDSVWRTGANAATQIVATRDVVFGHDTLRAGTYSVWTRVALNNAGYSLVFNSQTGQWGTEHHSERDVLSVPLSVERLPASVEKFTIRIVPLEAGSQLRLEWASTALTVPVNVAR